MARLPKVETPKAEVPAVEHFENKFKQLNQELFKLTDEAYGVIGGYQTEKSKLLAQVEDLDRKIKDVKTVLNLPQEKVVKAVKPVVLDTQSASAEIARLVSEASSLIIEAQSIADEYEIGFESPIDEYGMGGYYSGNEGWNSSSANC